MDPIAKTSLYTAILRARESARHDHLFIDPFAEMLSGPDGAEVLAAMEAGSGGASRNPAPIIRTKFFDDTLERLVDEPGLDQVVLLAAGMDARAFRLRLPPDVVVFEVDRPEVLELKASRLAKVNATPHCRRVPISADLTGDWPSALRQAGFDRHRPAVWLAEGLTPYLTDTELHQHLLGPLSELAATGSWLLVDVFSHTFLTSPQLAGFRAMMAANGCPLRFGTDHPDDFVTDHGWVPRVTRLGADEADYGRWIMPEGYHEDPDSPHGYLIVAHR